MTLKLFHTRRLDNMSYEKFITDFLNIEQQNILKLTSVNKGNGDIIVKVRLKPQPTVCPFCGYSATVHGYYPRKLTHSTFTNRKCTILYEQRRFICKECRCTFSEKNPFIESSEQLTYETKINILKDLKRPDITYQAIAERYNVSINRVIRIFDKHIDIGRKVLPTVLSIDEHHFPLPEYNSKYCLILMNFITGEIIDILRDRRKEYVNSYFCRIRKTTFNYSTNKSELDNVKYVSMDMYDNFRDISSIFFPNAIICADSFHVTKHLNDGFKQVRLRYKKNTDNKTLKYMLIKFHFVFNHEVNLDNEPRYNRSLNRYMNRRDIRDFLLSNFPDLKIAYELKEYYLNLNSTCTYDSAPTAIDNAIKLFSDCGIPEYDEFYTMISNWRDEIINSFIKINGNRINNSYIESKNRIIEKLMYNANGFKNFSRTRKRFLYCLNKNDTFKL